jgi:LmbE family N-acetylglucosaminyl deacetylase
VEPHFCTDITAVLHRKRAMLAAHASQKQWLDETQGMDAYLDEMERMSAEVGRMSGTYKFAEGGRRHSHLGFAAEDFDPVRDLLRTCQ